MKKIIACTKKNIKWLFCVVFLLLFLFIAKRLAGNDLEIFDNAIYNFIESIIYTPVTIFIKIITSMASPFVLVFVTIFLTVMIFKRKRYILLLVFNLINTVLLNIILKNIFDRPRPEELILINETGYSFPSGHSMAAMAFYGFIIYLIWQHKYSKKVKIIITVALSLLILLIGFSRIYLGVHYASDVIAGFSISLVYLIIFITFASKYIKGWMNNEEK